MWFSSRRFTKWAGLSAVAVALFSLSAIAVSDAQTSGTVVFAAIGDYGEDNGDHSDVAAMMDRWDPDFIITLGDNRYDNNSFDEVVGARYCDYLAGVRSGNNCSGGNSASTRFFPSLGNHDFSDGNGLNEYLDYFDLPGNERDYNFVQGPVHFFVLDSGTSGSLSQTQINQVQDGLESSTAEWQVVYFHHAPFSSGEHGSDSGMQQPFAEWGADAVIAGHDHHYERISRDGIVYFVNGLGGRSIRDIEDVVGGSQFRFNGDFGAMRIVANSSEITFEFRRVNGGDGQLIDSHTIQASGEPTTTTTEATTTTSAAPAPPTTTTESSTTRPSPPGRGGCRRC